MSYILSALRKAENDRRIGKVPDLMANEVAEEDGGAAYKTRTGVKFLIGLAVLLVINGALFVWMKSNEPPPNVEATFAPQGAPETRAQEAQSLFLSPPAPLNQQNDIAPRFGAAPRSPAAPQVPREIREIIETPAQAPTLPAETGAELVDYTDLPAATRERLPEMNVSGHIFAPDKPRSSRVIINGRLLRAGQIVEGDLRIEEIHAQEIIFELNGGRFRMRTSDLF